MGLFDRLFGSKSPSNVEALSDRIWISHQSKLDGVRKEVEERLQGGSSAVLVAHFPDTLDELNGIVAGATSGGAPTAVLAKNLTLDVAGDLNLDRSTMLDLIVAERHPLVRIDDELLQFAQELPCRCRIVHHLSLEDPLLKVFLGDWVQNLLKRLGMSEDESIESTMVTHRIKQSQQKIANQAFGDSQEHSAAEWFESNMPNAWKDALSSGN